MIFKEKIFFPFLILLFIFPLSLPSSDDHTVPPVPLTILHWNDFHSQNTPLEYRLRDESTGEVNRYRAGGYALLAGYVDSVRSSEHRTLILHGGDDFQGTLISTITRGESQIRILNKLRPDAFTLGNHEFDYGLDRLIGYFDEISFPVICANIVYAESGEHLTAPYVLIEKNGVRIAVIGLMTPDFPILLPQETVERLSVLDPSLTVRTFLPTMRDEDPHLIIALTHMGLDEDRRLARNVPELDLIVGGHSHTTLFSAVMENNVPIVQAGNRGRYLGRIDALVDTTERRIDTFTARLIELDENLFPVHAGIADLVDSLESTAGDALSDVIGTLTSDWIENRHGESNIGNWQADMMRSFARTDVAFQNSGGIRRSQLAGDITLKDIWEINPFGNTFVTFQVNGRRLGEMLEWMLDGRGEWMQVSGISVRYDPDLPFGRRILSMTVGQYPLDDERMYSVVTNNYVAGQLPALFGIEKRTPMIDLGITDREVFINAIRSQQNIHSEVEGRIVNINSHIPVTK